MVTLFFIRVQWNPNFNGTIHLHCCFQEISFSFIQNINSLQIIVQNSI
jgi:hypothetical protein